MLCFVDHCLSVLSFMYYCLSFDFRLDLDLQTFLVVKYFICIIRRKEIINTLLLSGTALTTILPILFLYLNTVTVTAGTFEP